METTVDTTNSQNSAIAVGQAAESLRMAEEIVSVAAAEQETNPEREEQLHQIQESISHLRESLNELKDTLEEEAAVTGVSGH